MLWKNRQLAANRMRYAGNGGQDPDGRSDIGCAAAHALAVPGSPATLARYKAAFDRFCSTFPDAFYVSERARVYLDPKSDKGNAAGCSARASTA